MAIYLPKDIIGEEILWRLPVKSLLRFRSVSKSWYSLISSTDFAKLHLKQASQIGIHKIILWHPEHAFRSVDHETSISSSDDLSTSRLLQLPFPIHEATFLVGSSNGLVCISNGFGKFVLWNPTTNDYKNIPDSVADNRFNRFEYRFGFGFGYDASTDDYQIIVGNGSIHIFSLKRGAWKCFRNTQSILSRYLTFVKCGVFLNGAVHWLCIERTADASDVRGYVILSFGLAEERFNYVSLPDNVKLSSMKTSRLGVLGGYLCLTTRWRGAVGSQMVWIKTVWIMKEHGVSSSWTVHCQNISSRLGDIFAAKHSAIVYVESLISPNAIKTECQRKCCCLE